MSFLSRLFGSSPTGRSSKDVDARLRRLEEEADRAAPGYVGTAYNRAGDLALREGRPEQAVGYYGRAIDAFLEDAQREAARGVANKIIRVRPSALRTLCTLTWLDLAAKHEATALLHLRDYVEGAKEREEQARAATQLYDMAKICPLGEFIEAVADSLDALDYPNRAREVRGWAADAAPEAIVDSDDLAHACLRAAIQSNERPGELLDDGQAPEGDEDEDGSGEGVTDHTGEPDEIVSGDDEDDVGSRDDDAEGDSGSSKKKLGRKQRKKEKRRYRWE